MQKSNSLETYQEKILLYNQKETILLVSLYLLTQNLFSNENNPNFILSSLEQAFYDLDALTKIRFENPGIKFGNDVLLEIISAKLKYIKHTICIKYEI